MQKSLELLPVPALQHNLAELEQDARFVQVPLHIWVGLGGDREHGHHNSLPSEPEGTRMETALILISVAAESIWTDTYGDSHQPQSA
jgi:hypothetical protein